MGMRFELVILGAGIFLIGCRGADEWYNQPPSTATIDPDSTLNNTGKGTTKKPKPSPMDYKKLIRRLGTTPTKSGMNQVCRFYHSTEGTNRFTGVPKSVSTKGLVTFYRIEQGLRDGYVFILFSKSANWIHQARYLRGLKNGRKYHWHNNGRLKIQGQFTNGVIVGTWFSWDENCQTNVMRLYNNSDKLIGIKNFLPFGMK